MSGCGKNFFGLVFSFLVIGCSGGGGGSSSSSNSTQTGVFLDSAVENIGYRTASQSGTTNSEGEFRYRPGEEVTFFIGDLELPPVLGARIVTPVEIAGALTTLDPEVVNIARLLQSLDDNGNPDDGIRLNDLAAQTATAVNFDQSVANFETDLAVTTLVTNSGSVNITLINQSDATSHLDDTLLEVEVDLIVYDPSQFINQTVYNVYETCVDDFCDELEWTVDEYVFGTSRVDVRNLDDPSSSFSGSYAISQDRMRIEFNGTSVFQGQSFSDPFEIVQEIYDPAGNLYSVCFQFVGDDFCNEEPASFLDMFVFTLEQAQEIADAGGYQNSP